MFIVKGCTFFVANIVRGCFSVHSYRGFIYLFLFVFIFIYVSCQRDVQQFFVAIS